jgi:hypothetical protein
MIFTALTASISHSGARIQLAHGMWDVDLRQPQPEPARRLVASLGIVIERNQTNPAPFQG